MPRRIVFRSYQGAMQFVVYDPGDPSFEEIVIDQDPMSLAHTAAQMTDAVAKHLYDLTRKE